MSDALVIRLALAPDAHHDADAPSAPLAQWLLADATGARLGPVFSGPLIEAATLASGRKVVVLANATEVQLSAPVLPNKRGAQAEQLMRYALEDQLASDVDLLHFAKGKRRNDGATPVATVTHTRVQAWLAALQAAGIAPDALYAESDVLPDGALTLVVDGGVLYLKRGQELGVALDAQPLDIALQLALQTNAESLSADEQLKGEQLVGDQLLAYVTQAEYEQHTAALNALREGMPTLQVKLLPEGPLPLFARQAMNGHAINLLSGPYARKTTLGARFAPWRIAAVLAGVALALHVGVSAMQYVRLGRAEKQVDAQLRDLVQQTLPGAPLNDPREARVLFESHLRATATGAAGGLLFGLDALAGTVNQSPNARIEAFAFRADTLDLRISVPSVDELARIQQSVNELGLHAEIQSATPRDNKTEGRLQVKLPGA